VAGKTGTTQDNADGWFILMQPGLVAGAWVGFDDGRVTLRSDYWGQGAHSALPIVGDFFQRAQRARIVDTKLKFDTEPSPGWFASVRERVTDLFDGWFGPEPKQAPAPVITQRIERQPEADSAAASAASAASAPEAASGGIVEEWVPASEVAASAAALSAGASQPQAVPPPAAGGSATSPGNTGGGLGSAPAAAPSAAPAPAPAPGSPDATSGSE
jgi:penicillin-binding protein 1A